MSLLDKFFVYLSILKSEPTLFLWALRIILGEIILSIS